MHSHLAECAQHEVHDGATEKVDQEYRWTSCLDCASGTVEQAGADRGTQRDEVNVSSPQSFKRSGWGRGGIHRDADLVSGE